MNGNVGIIVIINCKILLSKISYIEIEEFDLKKKLIDSYIFGELKNKISFLLHI